MAVKTFCDNIIDAYTHCEKVVAIYTHCQLVWPTGPTPGGNWYVSWTPTDIVGSFSMFGVSYNTSDYSGYFSWTGPASTSGMVTYRAFAYNNDNMSYMETNVKYIYGSAFADLDGLTDISMSRCVCISAFAFDHCQSLETAYMPRVQSVGSYAFWSCSSLQYVSLPRCTYIDSAAFSGCGSISYAYLPVVSFIGNAAFESCYALTSLYAPECEYVKQSAFKDCSLSELDLPNCVSIGTDAFWGNDFSAISLPVCSYIGNGAFGYCNNLKSVYLPALLSCNGGFEGCYNLEYVNLPVCSDLGNETFMSCPFLRSVYLPSVQRLGYDTFTGCSRLERVELSNCVSISGSDVFRSCTLLSYVDIGHCSYINSYMFSDCLTLSYLVLRYDGVVGPNGSYVQNLSSNFTNTPLMDCRGIIYVPGYLLAAYRSDGQWWQFSCALRPIQESGSYYISWSPSSMSSGTFKIAGYSCYMSDFDGYFCGFPSSFNGVFSTYSYQFNILSTASVEYVETNVKEVYGMHTFGGNSLKSINFTECTSIGGDGILLSCSTLTSVNAPMCKYISGRQAFDGCSRLSDISFPVCEYIGHWAFRSCSSLTSIDFPAVKEIDYECFSDCRNLSYVNLPACEYLSHSVFNNCINLTTISLPACKSIGLSIFASCSSLSVLDLPVCSYIKTLLGRTASLTVILRSSSMVSGWYGCYQDNILSVYVPSSLVSEYKAEYSSIKSRFFPIPEP